jgi:hypothetical protein
MPKLADYSGKRLIFGQTRILLEKELVKNVDLSRQVGDLRVPFISGRGLRLVITLRPTDKDFSEAGYRTVF